MALSEDRELSKCLINTNCIFAEWEFNNTNEKYQEILKIASNLPRCSVLEESKNYWHGLIRSRIFRFPDDLEILNLPERKLIQVKSASRIGVSDLGVNRNRVNYIYNQLLKSNE